MNELIGRVIAGRYRVDAFLGKGGTAEVYQVWDRNRSVPLAMKILHADLAEDKIFLRRFRREAQTLAKLQHPNIVRFYGLGQDNDLVFMLMEYVEGTTLRKEIFKSDAPFSLESVARIIRPVCAALHYAHQSGFIHCDIKPANIMIHKNGTILVADFGIARITEAATMTMVGAGTPAYMAPEQARGENPVLETDIYALGVVLFELLTGGERPFIGEHAHTTGSTSEKIRWEQLNVQPPSPTKFNPSISPNSSTLILKCLNKEPKNRYNSALDLLGAFEHSITARKAGISSSKEKDEILEESTPKSTPKSSSTKRDAEKHEGFLKSLLIKLNLFPPIFEKLSAFFKFSQPKSANLPETPAPIHKRRVFLSSVWRKNGIWTLASAIVIATFLYFSSILGITNKQDRIDRRSGSPSALSNAGTLYFTSNRDGKPEIYKLTGGKVIRVTHTEDSAESWAPFLSSAGTLYFTSNREGNVEIYKLTREKVIRVTHTSGTAESWAPILSNTGTLYFTSNREGNAEIYKLTGEKVTRVTNTNGNSASWGQYPAGNGLNPNSNLSSRSNVLLSPIEMANLSAINKELATAKA